MKIIVDGGGQTCNRLWGYLGPVFECLENNERLIILIPDITIESFKNLLDCDFIFFPLYSKKLTRIIGIKNNLFIINIFKKIFINQYLQIFYSIFLTRNIEFIKGKDYWSKIKNYDKFRNEIKCIFEPSCEIIEKVNNIFMNYRESGYFIIGVHIRWGDYRTWKNGQYYFEIDIYKLYMEACLKIFSQSKVVFFISSNTIIDNEILKDYHHFIIEKKSVVEDLHGLSLCDRIIGPISSFSTWASFIGEVPYLSMNGTNYDFNESMFSTTINWDFALNGTKYDRT